MNGMGKVGKNSGSRSARVPDKYKKIDPTVNGDAGPLAGRQREAERGLCPLRLDKRTVIYVPEGKCTEEYAERKRRLLGITRVSERRGGPDIHVDVEEIKSLVVVGISPKEIARQLGISRTTVSKYMRKYDLKKGKE